MSLPTSWERQRLRLTESRAMASSYLEPIMLFKTKHPRDVAHFWLMEHMQALSIMPNFPPTWVTSGEVAHAARDIRGVAFGETRDGSFFLHEVRLAP